MKDLVVEYLDKILHPIKFLTVGEKEEFGKLCSQGEFRKRFSYLLQQRRDLKLRGESVFLKLQTSFSILLFECHDNEDYETAKALMNMAFTFYTECKIECVEITPMEFEIEMLDNEEEVCLVYQFKS